MGACVGWTFNTADRHCQSFRLITASEKCNVCISRRLVADEGAPAGVLNEADPHAQPGTRQHLYARGVLSEALQEGQRVSKLHRLDRSQPGGLLNSAAAAGKKKTLIFCAISC